MADLGLEPQSVHVTAFHAAKLAPSLKIGEKEDLDVRDRRVAVLGLEEFSERQSEFDFDATHGSDALPSEVTQAAVQPLTQATVAGINSLLLATGAGTSASRSSWHGQDESKGEWNGLMEAAIESLFNALPSDALSEAENLYRVRMQFLSVYHERVIDLLQPNCHAHDLPLKARAGAGIEVIGADEVEVEMRGMQKAVRIYRGARDQLALGALPRRRSEHPVQHDDAHALSKRRATAGRGRRALCGRRPWRCRRRGRNGFCRRAKKQAHDCRAAGLGEAQPGAVDPRDH